ncbi:sulfatase [Daejeonella sp.]|uniref:sulfatase family protein n=1 Tax=Daejeonella sp. TaxID=2805397 RepID=UPI0030EB82F1
MMYKSTSNFFMGSRKCLLTITFIGLTVLPIVSFKKKQAQKPNIIFLLADDLRYNSLGSMGNSIVKTPNLDRLASQGTLFKNAFVTTSICCISRASIFSGQNAARHRILDFKTDFTDSVRMNNFPALLKRNGYYTGFIGKYGVGTHLPDIDYDYWKGFPGQGVYFYKDAAGKSIHSTDMMGDQAVEFLRRRDKSKPFCLQVSFKAPHVEDNNPLHNGYLYSPFYENYYNKVTIPPPPTGDSKFYLAFPETFRVNSKGIPNEARVRWEQRFSTPDKYQESIKSYYRLVTGIDDALKRIVDELVKNGLEKNTVIIFSSDNGYALGDHGLEGKWFGQNESIRVPTIIYDGRSPQVQHNNDQLVLNIDLAPTILDYAGIPVPASMQGSSLKPLALGKTPSWRMEFYYEHQYDTDGSKVYLPKSEGLVRLKYKYMRYFNGIDPDNFFYEELYDQLLDPFEVHNLSNTSDNSVLKEQMIQKLKQMRIELK